MDKLLSQAHDTAFIPLQGLLLNGSAQSKAPFLMQLKSIAAIRETLMVADEDVVCSIDSASTSTSCRHSMIRIGSIGEIPVIET